MAATLVSSNTTLRVSAAVSATGSTPGGGGTTTLYTAPSTGYAIVQLRATAVTTLGEIVVGSRVIATYTAASTSPITNVFIGPSQTLQVSSTGSNAITVVASGVEFSNSP